MTDSAASNAQELTVSELAADLKRAVETRFDRVRVRGELGRVTIARSGHMYADIKDDRAVLNTVMWKGQVNALPFRPEEGLEVVAEGKLSIYAGRSNYQLIASSMRPAGTGALMALLEERRKKLAAEGLFDPAHKQALPTLPTTIGVVTSPTGAVIRDILHRIRERFPVRVIVWPALVQGDLAAAQIVAGIRGFNAMQSPTRPDVLIVGRGGGSIEDLWPFNEEAVVRAAFESQIPLISAVGHETDTTLIDYVADARAPTPTGAAEIAVPVRADLLLANHELGQRLARGLHRRVQTANDRLRASRLPRAQMLVERQRQRLDFAQTALPRAIRSLADAARSRLDRASLALPSPIRLVSDARQAYSLAATKLSHALATATRTKRLALVRRGAGLRLEPVKRDMERARRDLLQTAARIQPAFQRAQSLRARALEAHSKLLQTLSYGATLARGFVIVRNASGDVIRSKDKAVAEPSLRLVFGDGDMIAHPSPDDVAPKSAKTVSPLPKTTPSGKSTKRSDQGDLF